LLLPQFEFLVFIDELPFKGISLLFGLPTPHVSMGSIGTIVGRIQLFALLLEFCCTISTKQIKMRKRFKNFLSKN